jgi:hypothetical protein
MSEPSSMIERGYSKLVDFEEKSRRDEKVTNPYYPKRREAFDLKNLQKMLSGIDLKED